MHLLVGVLLKVRVHYCVAVGVGQDTNMLDTLLLDMLLLSGMEPLTLPLSIEDVWTGVPVRRAPVASPSSRADPPAPAPARTSTLVHSDDDDDDDDAEEHDTFDADTPLVTLHSLRQGGGLAPASKSSTAVPAAKAVAAKVAYSSAGASAWERAAKPVSVDTSVSVTATASPARNGGVGDLPVASPRRYSASHASSPQSACVPNSPRHGMLRPSPGSLEVPCGNAAATARAASLLVASPGFAEAHLIRLQWLCWDYTNFAGVLGCVLVRLSMLLGGQAASSWVVLPDAVLQCLAIAAVLTVWGRCVKVAEDIALQLLHLSAELHADAWSWYFSFVAKERAAVAQFAAHVPEFHMCCEQIVAAVVACTGPDAAIHALGRPTANAFVSSLQPAVMFTLVDVLERRDAYAPALMWPSCPPTV